MLDAVIPKTDEVHLKKKKRGSVKHIRHAVRFIQEHGWRKRESFSSIAEYSFSCQAPAEVACHSDLGVFSSQRCNSKTPLLSLISSLVSDPNKPSKLQLYFVRRATPPSHSLRHL